MSQGLASRLLVERRAPYFSLEPGLKPPISPHASNVEFLDYSNGTNPTTVGLSWGNQSTRTATIKQGRLVIVQPSGASNAGGLFVAEPTGTGGSFTATARARHAGKGNYVYGGIAYLVGGLASPTDMRLLAMAGHTETIALHDFTNYGTWQSQATGGRTIRNSLSPLYLRIDYNGTGTLTAYYSMGVDEWVQCGQFTGVSDPSHIGLVMMNDSGSGEGDSYGFFDFFRFDWTPDYDPTT